MDSYVKTGGELIAVAAAVWIFYFALVYGVQNSLWTDEGDYVLLAKSISETGQFAIQPTDPLGILSFSQRSYALPYFTAVMSFFAGDYIYSGHLAVALLCALAVLATYLLARRLFGDLPAIAAVLLLVFSHLLWFYSSRVLTDAPQMFFAALGLYAFFRTVQEKSPNWMVVFVLAILLGGFTKYIFFSIVLGLAVGAYLYRDAILKTMQSSPKMTGLCVLLLVAFAAAFFSYQFAKSGSAFGLAGDYFTGAQGYGQADEFLFITQANWIFNNSLGAILVLLGVVYAFIKKDDNAAILALVFLLPLLIMTFLFSYKEDRFIIFLLPVAFVLAGRVLGDAINAVADAASGKAAIGFWTGVSGLLILFLLSASVGNLDQCWSLYEGKKDSYSQVQEASYFIENITKPGEWVMASGHPQVGAYSGRPALGLDPNYTTFLNHSATLNASVYMTSLLEVYAPLVAVFTALQNGTELPGNTYYHLFADTDKYELVKYYSTQATAQNGSVVDQPVVFVFKKR
ncbi:MAG: glycosyltransferase family 39 protein [Candidatus Micrarchaeia archaeon]